MNTVTSRSGKYREEGCRSEQGKRVVGLNRTLTKSHKNTEQWRSVPVHLEDTKSTGSLHNTPLQILTIFNFNNSIWLPAKAYPVGPTEQKEKYFDRENCPSTGFNPQMKNTTPNLPGWKEPFNSLRTSRKGSHFQRIRKSRWQRLPAPPPLRSSVEHCPIEIRCQPYKPF